MERKKMTKRETIVPAGENPQYDEYRYSAAIKSGDLIFASGHTGSRSDGTPEPNFKKQVELAFISLIKTLKAAGCTLDDVIDVTTFHTDPESQFNDVAEIRNQFITAPPYPNWTAVGVNWLNGFDFEIKVVARIPSKI